MDILKVISGPLVGAIIGYFTNYIAIKMLFRPLKPIKIAGITLPFTPGIIPKRKDKLAEAIGNAIGQNLFTKNDIQKILLSEEVSQSITENIIEALNKDVLIKDLFLNVMDDTSYDNAKNDLILKIYDILERNILKLELGNIIANEAYLAVKSKIDGTMLKMFVKDETIKSMIEPMAYQFDNYILNHGKEKILPLIESEVKTIEQKPLNEFTQNLDSKRLEIIIKNAYIEIVTKEADKFLEKFDIEKIVEEKIKKMDVLELEKLVLSIMKKELNSIVNLGALIGLVIGIINIFL